MRTMLAIGAVLFFGFSAHARAQEDATPEDASSAAAKSPATDAEESKSSEVAETLSQADGEDEGSGRSASDLAEDARRTAEDLTKTLDQNETVQQASAGILQPLYVAAEAMAFPAFYWLAFALMTAGVVSFLFQLVFAKLVVLAKGSISSREVISDAVGMIISAIGLILTTQAATENSSFPESPTSVISAAVAGVVLGVFLYRWGQAEEVEAARGRKKKR